MTDPTIARLIAATRKAYVLLVDGADSDAVYARLAETYEAEGLDANVAESSVDWLEGGTLADDVADAYEASR